MWSVCWLVDACVCVCAGFIALAACCCGWRQHQAALAPSRQRDNHKQIIFQLLILRGVQGIFDFRVFFCVCVRVFLLLISPTAAMQPAEQEGALI